LLLFQFTAPTQCGNARLAGWLTWMTRPFRVCSRLAMQARWIRRQIRK